MDPVVTIPFPLTSMGGIIASTMFLLAVLKAKAGNTKFFKEFPVWVYACVISFLLTGLAIYVFHTLPPGRDTMWNALVAAGMASGMREWWLTWNKPLSSTSAARNQGGQ